ncbi:MAG: short chain dehydrogenase, partial [Acidimicrobiaceae bacterium]|nr:short chain dehydrogenase [Acidimicrobiaceae bacterium]
MPGLSAGLSAGLGAGRFDGATAIVTGAASGIGTVIAGRLLAEGARVVVADRSDDTEAAT